MEMGKVFTGNVWDSFLKNITKDKIIPRSNAASCILVLPIVT